MDNNLTEIIKGWSSYEKLVGEYIHSVDIPLLHRASLNYLTEPEGIRKTAIIATIGPKTNSIETIQALRDVGMNIVRLNFSHGSHEYHGSVIKNVRNSYIDKPGRQVAIALDTKGPEIRTGMMADSEKGFDFKTGHKFKFSTDPKFEIIGNKDCVYIDYKNLPSVTAPGKFIYVDDGTMTFKVLSVNVEESFVEVEAQNNGTFLSKKGVNLPHTNVDLPPVSEKDKLDLAFAVSQNLDMVFASFIRSAQDIHTIRGLLGEKGKDIKIIAKIENHQGLENFDQILKAADGIMVARGDLGTEIPSWKVFVAQKQMIAKCNIAGKPVICATQMMQSMTSCPKPTRAEATDVANAVLDGADCVMLSAETASGQYPLESVKIMARIVLEAESVISYVPFFNELKSITPKPLMTTETIAVAAVNASMEEGANVIVVLSTTGTTARLIAKYRPKAAILAVTRNEVFARQAHLFRGVYPVVVSTKPVSVSEAESSPLLGKFPTKGVNHASWKQHEEWQLDVDERIDMAFQFAKELKLVSKGGRIVCVQGWRPGSGQTNCLRILTVYE